MRQRSYFPTLDGWRAVSVIGVILYHGRSGFFRPYSIMMRLSAHGDIGVNAFFAISGFLICSLLLEEFARTGDLNLRSFYRRRCFRILPPYYFALAVICVLPLFGVIHVNFSEIPSCLFFYRNYKPLGVDQQGGFYTAHFWSLAVEEHFYLLWPLLLLAVKPKRAGKVAFTLAMLVLGWRLSQTHLHFLSAILPPQSLLSRTDTRIDGLLWGCLAAIYLPEIKRVVERLRYSQLWLPVLLILLITEALRLPDVTFLRSVLLAALVVSTVLQPESLLGQVLESKWLRCIGTISYSLYIWQELFLPEAKSEVARGPLQNLQHWPGNVLAMLVCACLSRYLLEIPITRWGRDISANSRSSREIPSLPFPWPAPMLPQPQPQTGTHGIAPSPARTSPRKRW